MKTSTETHRSSCRSARAFRSVHCTALDSRNPVGKAAGAPTGIFPQEKARPMHNSVWDASITGTTETRRLRPSAALRSSRTACRSVLTKHALCAWSSAPGSHGYGRNGARMEPRGRTDPAPDAASSHPPRGCFLFMFNGTRRRTRKWRWGNEPKAKGRLWKTP